MILNTAMPAAAKRAYEQAHQQRGNKRNPTAGSKKPKTERSYRLTAAYREWRDDERAYRESRNSRRADIQALQARTFLLTQATPKETARRLELRRMKQTAREICIAKARSPERQRAAMVRHMNTTCYEILKQRGFK